MRLFRWSAGIAAAAALAACGPTAPDQNAGVVGDDEVTANDLLANDTAPVDGPLAVYVGRYPFDDVDGVAFRDHPLVRAAVARAGGENAPVEQILTGPGPSTPIATGADGRILSWGCEQHNCGPHNWTLLVAADGSNATLCYNDARNSAAPMWLVDGQPTDRQDDCPSE